MRRTGSPNDARPRTLEALATVSEVGHVKAALLPPPCVGDEVAVAVGEESGVAVTLGELPPPLQAETKAASAASASRRRGMYKSVTLSGFSPRSHSSYRRSKTCRLAAHTRRRDVASMTTTLANGLASASPSEVAFSGTVLNAPHFFYGTNTHAMHEAFDVRSDDGHRVEVVDNVKLAPRVPVMPGDRVSILGELVPETNHGPLVHWTHHDPAHVHPDGYIELNGRRYA